MVRFISYYTKSYSGVMNNYLLPSLIQWELPYYVEEVKDLGSWKNNTDFKPHFILQCLNKFNDDVVFTDADSIINKFPILFWTIQKEGYDLAYHLLKWNEHYPQHKNSNKTEVLSGTLFLKNNEKIRQLINKWIELSNTSGWEQVALGKAIKLIPDLKIYLLPRDYCYICSTPRGEPLNPLHKGQIVIEHFQYGREFKRRLRKAKHG
jgi:hypothetical protein